MNTGLSFSSPRPKQTGQSDVEENQCRLTASRSAGLETTHLCLQSPGKEAAVERDLAAGAAVQSTDVTKPSSECWNRPLQNSDLTTSHRNTGNKLKNRASYQASWARRGWGKSYRRNFLITFHIIKYLNSSTNQKLLSRQAESSLLRGIAHPN